MTYFLLTWDFRRIEDEIQAAELAERCATRGKARNNWSVGNTRKVRPKDIAFMLRQGSEPRGIIAAGVIRSEPYLGRHWRNGKREKALYVDIDWTRFAVEPFIGSSELQQRFKQVYWHPRRSVSHRGMRIFRRLSAQEASGVSDKANCPRRSRRHAISEGDLINRLCSDSM